MEKDKRILNRIEVILHNKRFDAHSYDVDNDEDDKDVRDGNDDNAFDFDLTSIMAKGDQKHFGQHRVKVSILLFELRPNAKYRM